MGTHATSGWTTSGELSRSEALRAAWGSFTGNLGNASTVWKANHTFYDTLTHWGSEWKDFSFQDPSTWLPGAAHLVFNDIVLGALALPVAVVESVVTNVYSAVTGWFAGGSYDASSAYASGASLYDLYGGYDFGVGSSSYSVGGGYSIGVTNFDFGASYNLGAGSYSFGSSSYDFGGGYNYGSGFGTYGGGFYDYGGYGWLY